MSFTSAVDGGDSPLSSQYLALSQENKTVAKTHRVFEALEIEEPDDAKLAQPVTKWSKYSRNERIAGAAFLVLSVVFIGGIWYLASRATPGTALQCKPIFPLNDGQGLRTIGFDPSLLPNLQETKSAGSVLNQTLTWAEDFSDYETKLKGNWKNLPTDYKFKAVSVINRKGQAVAESRVTCLTGEVFSEKNPAHVAMAALLRLPYSTETDVTKPLYQLRTLNENFPPLVDNPTFVEICEEFMRTAQLRDKHPVLASDGKWEVEWQVADYSAWIKETERVLKPYTEKAKFGWMPYLGEISNSTLANFENAPPRDQIAAVQAMRDQATAIFYNEESTEEQRKKAEIAIHEFRVYQPALQYTARTGEWKSDWNIESIFSELYNPSEFFTDVYLKSLSRNLDEIQNLIDQGDPNYPETRVKDMTYSLYSIAQSLNGTRGYGDTTPFLTRIEQGFRFGDQVWKPFS